MTDSMFYSIVTLVFIFMLVGTYIIIEGWNISVPLSFIWARRLLWKLSTKHTLRLTSSKMIQ